MAIGRSPALELGGRVPAGTAFLAAVAWLVASGCGGEAPGDGATSSGDVAGDADVGGPVADVEELEPPTGPGSGQPRLSVGPDGAVLLSWLRPAGEGEAHELAFSELSRTGWSEPRAVARGDDFFVNWADLPSVSRTAGDTLVAHWLRKTGPGPYAYGIRVSFSADGGRSWSEPIVPHRDGTRTEHGFVSLLPAEAGGVRAVWLDGRRMADEGTRPETADGAADGRRARAAGSAQASGDGSGEGGGAMTLRSAVVHPEGGLRSPSLVDGRVCDCCQTSAAGTSRGPLVVYRDRSPEEVRDISAVRLEEDGWTAPTAVHRDGWRIHACPVNGPSVDARGDTAAVAWFTGADDRPRVRAAFSTDAGDSFGPPVDVDGGEPAGRVDVALLDDSRALVSWVESTAEGAEIRLRAVGPEGATGPAAALAPASAARAGGFPRMAVVGEAVVVAWTDPDGDGRVRAVRARLSDR